MSKPTWVVTSPMIQLTGPHAANSNLRAAVETIFRAGDTLPAWAKPDEIDRLATDGFIARAAA